MEAFVLHEPLRAKPMLMTTSTADKMRITETTLRGLFIRLSFPPLRTGAVVLEKGEAGETAAQACGACVCLERQSLGGRRLH
jgi:hypothetical protein